MSKNNLAVFPGCPSLSWILANRVVKSDSDIVLTCVGRKGAGKSTLMLSLAEDTARLIAQLRGKGEPATKFFNASHIRTIDAKGAADLLSGGILQQPNSVLIIDDAGTQIAGRSFMSKNNRAIGQICQIARVYNCVLLLNFIAASHIDVQIRSMADFRIEVQFKDVPRKKTYFKCYEIDWGKYGEIIKHVTWNGKRIVLWQIGMPSPALNKDYKAMRMANSDLFISEQREKLFGDGGCHGMPKEDKRLRQYDLMPIVVDNREKVLTQYAKGVKLDRIAHNVGITRYWAAKIISLEKQKETPNV